MRKWSCWGTSNLVTACSGEFIYKLLVAQLVKRYPCLCVATEFHYSIHRSKQFIRTQWNILQQTAASRCEGLQTFREITPSPSSRCTGGSVAHPGDGDGVRSRNVGKPSHLDKAVCSRKFHWILSPQKLEDLWLIRILCQYRLRIPPPYCVRSLLILSSNLRISL